MFISNSALAQKTRVACVGNSVTYGAGIENREVNSYPSQLQVMLGEDYIVGNFGRSGATLLRKGHNPYNLTEEYKKALDFNADQVVIHLGLNDTDPRNWPNHRGEFIEDYMTLINSFRERNPDVKIYVCRLTPISHRHSRFKSGTRDWYWQIQATIEQMAASQDLQLIDLQKELYVRPELLPDGLHPNGDGATLIAREVYGAITGDFGGLTMEPIYSDNMILQRERELKIAGRANAGEKVTVKFAGQSVSTSASSCGDWNVYLKPLKVGKPRTLTISASSRTLEFKDVLVGEIWLAAGQSNMEWSVQQCNGAKEGIATAGEYSDKIRVYNQREIYHTDDNNWSMEAMDSINQLMHYHPTKWENVSSENVAGLSAVAYYFARSLSDSLEVPVGIVANAVGGSPIESWIDRKTLEFELPDILSNWLSSDMVFGWVRERASQNLKLSNNPLQRHPYQAAYLFETAIAPIKDFTMAGAIWYQGESNAHNIELHAQLFPMMIRSWRGVFGEDFPVNFVQLSSVNRPSWPHFRDSQRELADGIEGVAMVVSSDKGDEHDVHPRDKKIIGDRLARVALAENYNWDICPAGPMFEDVEFSGGALWVSFENNEGMKSSDGDPLRGFEIAELPGIFRPAKAEVVDGKIKLSARDIKNPRYVRYGWRGYTDANLVNEFDLPASTFSGELE